MSHGSVWIERGRCRDSCCSEKNVGKEGNMSQVGEKETENSIDRRGTWTRGRISRSFSNKLKYGPSCRGSSEHRSGEKCLKEPLRARGCVCRTIIVDALRVNIQFQSGFVADLTLNGFATRTFLFAHFSWEKVAQPKSHAAVHDR